MGECFEGLLLTDLLFLYIIMLLYFQIIFSSEIDLFRFG